MKAAYHKYILDFKQPSGTSRGVMTDKETWFIIIENNQKKGVGECGILRGLSCDDRPDYEVRPAAAACCRRNCAERYIISMREEVRRGAYAMATQAV